MLIDTVINNWSKISSNIAITCIPPQVIENGSYPWPNSFRGSSFCLWLQLFSYALSKMLNWWSI
jgi:hypothetical protein